MFYFLFILVYLSPFTVILLYYIQACQLVKSNIHGIKNKAYKNINTLSRQLSSLCTSSFRPASQQRMFKTFCPAYLLYLKLKIFV